MAALRADGAPIWQEDASDEGARFGGHLPVTAHYRQVDLPQFGDRVLYVEELTFDDNPYRQRIYTIAVDDQAQVRVKLWSFKNKVAYAGAWRDLSVLNELTPDEMSPLPDQCDLLVTMGQEGRAVMMMPRDQCVFGERLFDYRVSLSASDFWFRDRIAQAQTRVVLTTAGSFTWHRLDRLPGEG
ncbi:MAG: chromophore lyase CpcT/CpeT [Pseudomonadota bacterium]